MGKAYTPERLMRTRRMRKARRLFKQTPLFALALMQQQYPHYSEAELRDDLRRRTKKKKRQRKTPLTRYGRYGRMQELLGRYAHTKDQSLLWLAMKLRERLTKPYRVMATVEGQRLEFTFSPIVPIRSIERLTEDLGSCETKEEVLQVVANFRETEHYS